MIEIKFYRDESGHFKAETSLDNHLLSDYFEADIMGIEAVCREIIEKVDEVAKGKVSNWSGTGNCCTLFLTKDKAIIEATFATPSEVCEISLDDFRRVLVDCLTFINESE